MELKDWIIMLTPIIINFFISIIVINYQSRINKKIKKMEKSQNRREAIIDEYIQIISEFTRDVNIICKKIVFFRDVDSMEVLRDHFLKFSSFCNQYKFLAKKHEQQIDSIRKKTLYDLSIIKEYTKQRREKENIDLLESLRKNVIDNLSELCFELRDLQEKAMDL